MPVRADSTERRWERAHRIAAGYRDPAVRRASGMWIGLIFAVTLGVGVAAGLTIALVGRAHRRPVRHVAQHHATGVLLVVAVALSAAGLLLIVTGLVQTIRQGRQRQRPRWLDSPMLALTYRERRRVLRQVYRKDPADPRILDITVKVAERLHSQRQLRPILFIGIAACSLGNAILTPSASRYFLAGLYAVMAVMALPVAALPGRRAARFLNQHPAAHAGTPH